MIRIRGFFALLLAFALIVGLSSCARECAPEVREGWVRLPPKGQPMLAGFGRIENRCTKAITIVGASSPTFAEVSLHETRIDGGMSRMRAVAQLRIGSDDAVTLKPGGMHLMLMQPRTALQAGSRLIVEFALQDGGTLRGEFVVRKPGE